MIRQCPEWGPRSDGCHNIHVLVYWYITYLSNKSLLQYENLNDIHHIILHNQNILQSTANLWGKECWILFAKSKLDVTHCSV